MATVGHSETLEELLGAEAVEKGRLRQAEDALLFNALLNALFNALFIFVQAKNSGMLSAAYTLSHKARNCVTRWKREEREEEEKSPRFGAISFHAAHDGFTMDEVLPRCNYDIIILAA